MIRQAFSRARQTAVAAVFGASLALAPAPAHAFWDTKKAWNDMLQFAVKQVNAPGEFEIILGEVTKPEEGFALISTLQIKDGDGIWLDASNLLVDWSPTALLRGRFIFDTLSAEEIAILRAPIGRGDPPADEAQVAFAWPRPPVPIGIDALKVDRLRIEGGLLPQDIEAKVTGAFKDIGDVQDATLVVQRTDRPGDRIALTSQIDFDDLDIAFKLEANEEPGGLVAEMASLPPDQALKLDLESKGTPENLAFELFADIGQIGIAKGKGSTSFNGLITAKFDGRIEPGEKTADDWRRALGEAALIKVDFAEVSKGTYDLKMLEIDSPAFELDGKGEVDVAGNKIDLALNWDAKDIAAFNQVIAPASVTELDGTARAVGRLSAPKLDVNAKVAGLDAAFGKADAVLLRIDSEPLTQDRETPGAPQGFTFEAKADGLALADESLQEALGPTPSFAGKGQFNGVENRVTLDTLKIDARSVQLDGNAAYDIGTGSMDAELSGEARELGPFFKAAGVPVDGRAALAFKLEGLQSGTLDRLFLNAQMSNLSSTDADIAAALGEEAILELLLTESGADTIEVERGVFESNVLKAEASGAISIPGDTVDLTVAFDVLDADAIAGLIEPAEVGDAEGKATLTGTLSEPQVSVKATASDLGFEDYAAESAQIDGSVQYRKDRRAPFALTAALEGVTTGDDDLDAVVGASPQVEATGLYDTATGLLSLSKMEADLADADLSLTGDVQLRKKTLDVAYDLEAGDLSGFSGLIGKPLDGSVDISGRAEGPFALPFVTAKGTARDLRFDTYSVDAADLDIEMLPGDDGPAPFKLDVTAINPKTGDAALDELIGENPSLRAKGTLDREGPAIVLEYLDADLATMKAEAKGSVDVGTRLMDLAFDVDASELDGLTALLGTEVAGAVTANGSAKGSFAAPEVDAAIDATGLRYGDYAVGSVKGSLDIQQAASGYAPFDIDIEARDVTTGDAALDDLLADASTVKAKGAFNQAEQKLRLESATVIAAGAVASASGDIDIAGKALDVAFEVEAEDLSAFEGLAGVALDGTVSAKGTAAGTLTAPEVDVALTGRGLRYEQYRVGEIDGKIDIAQAPSGFAPFDIDAVVQDVTTGDAALDDLLADASTVKAKGAFNQAEQKLRLESATVIAAGAVASASGNIDIAGKALDVAFEVEAEDLSAFEGLAGVTLDGTVSAKGTAAGTLTAPEVDVALTGRGLRYEQYRVGEIDGKIDIAQAPNGFAPFDIDVVVQDVTTGDAALDDLLADASTVKAKGAFNQAEQKLRLESATVIAAGAVASASGDIDIAGKALDVAFEVEAEDLSAFEGLAGVALDGTVSAKGTAAGTLTAPEVDVALTGRGLRYGQYRVGEIDGKIDIAQAPNGFAPFDIDVVVQDVTTGDVALDDLLADASTVKAKGAFNQAEQKLRLESATVIAAGAVASASGDIDIAGKALDVAFEVEAEDLSAFEGLAGVALDGTVSAKGTAAGTLAAPEVDVALTGRGLRYEQYRVGEIDGKIDIAQAPNGFAPFDIDVAVRDVTTGDAALDDLLADASTVKAKGAFNQAEQKLRLESATVIAAGAVASASGNIDIAGKALDVAFEVEAEDLSAFEGLAGVALDGTVSAKGTAAGTLTAPEVDVALTGRGLRYEQYRVGEIDGKIDIAQAPSGFAPFDIDVVVQDVTTGDAALDDLLADASTVKAKGAFNQAEQKLRLESATVIAAGAVASASGNIDIAGKALDVAFEVEAEDLSAFEGLAGVALDGTVSAKGTAAGTLTAPEVDVALTGRGLRYEQYRVGEIDGKIDIAQAPSGFAPFDIDVAVRDVTTGDAALDDLLADASTVKAKGAFNQAEQKLRLESATVIAAGAVASASGDIDIAGKALDVAFEVEAEDLSAFEGLAGVALDGTVSAKGTAAGTLTAPEVDVALTGRGLRYDGYSAASLDGVVAIEQAETGYAPFKIDARANGLSLGDPALNEAFKDGVKIDAAGGFDRSAQRIRLDRGRFETDAATADVTGVVNLGAKRLDVAFDVDASDLGVFGKIAGVDAGGALKAKGTAKGPFVIPQVNASVSGRKLRYDAYRVASLDGAVAMDTATDGVAPFDMDIKASGIRTGDAALDEAIGDEVRVDATGGFDAKAQKLRLDAAKLTADFATADLSGRVDLAAKTLDLAFDVDAARLAPLSPILGTDIAGAVAMQGTAKGPFSLPAINAGLAGRGIAYDKYGIARLDGRIDTGTAAGDALPFDVDLTAGGITTGDPVLDDALGENVRVDARGRFDRGANVLRLTEAALLSDFAEATASGTVNLGAKTLDIAFDMDAKRLAAFGPLAKAELGGSLALSGTAKGAFVIPMVDAAIDGEAIRFNQYSIGRLNGSVDVGQAVNGALPFDIDVTAAGLVTGDAALDQTIGEAVTVDATGTFAPDSQVVVLDAARFRADFATANASGRVDLKTQTLDVGFDVEAADLSPFSAVTGQAMAGSVAMRGSARGPFNIPAVDANIAARRLTFGAYGAGQLDGALSLGLAKDGFAPFSVDMTGGGLSLGDPALDAAFGSRVDIDATGAVDIAQKRIRIDRAKLATDAAAAALNGSVDLGAKTVDLAFDVEAANLAPFGPLASADLAGSMAMKGRATGPFVIPRVNANIAGSGIRYNQYTVGRIDGTVDMDSPQNGVTPFTVGLNTAGIGTGNPALDDLLRPEVRLAANGGFNQSAKLLRLDEARVTSALAQVSARGTVDLAAQMLDLTFGVDAGEIAPLSGLVGADLAGALALGGSVSGPFASPSIATTLDGRALRYQQYTVASLTGTASFSQVAGGYGPFAIDAAAAGIGTGDPSLDFALKDGVSVKGAGGFDATNQRLRLDRFTAQARFASVDASGLVDLGMKSMDVTFALDASDLSPLSAVIGKPMGGALKASGTARGAFSAPVVNMNAQGGGLYFDQYSLGGLSLNLTMPGDAPGYLPFTLTGNVSQPRLNNPQIEYLIGETVTVRAEGVFDPTRQLLRLTDSQVQTNSAWVGAFGDVDLTNRMLAVEYHANLLDLSIAQQIAGKTLAGAARLRGQISGSLDDPSTSGQLTGQGLVYDRYRMTSLTAQYDLQRLVTGPAGAVSLDGQTEFGPLAASARFDLTGGALQVQQISVNGLGIGLDGNFRTGTNGTLAGAATLMATDLAQLGAFLGQDIAGRVDGSVTLTDEQGRQNAVFDIRGGDFRYGPAANPTAQFAAFEARGQVADAFGRDPYLDATFGGSNGKIAAFPVNRIDATARGTFSALDTTVTASGGALGSDKVELVARVNGVNPPRSASVTRLALAYQGRQATIIEPLVIEEIVPRGWRLRNLDLRAEDGEVRGSAEYGPSGLVADLTIRNFPLALASLSGVDLIQSGRLDGNLDIDTRGGVRGTFDLAAVSLRLKGAQIDDPFAITAKGVMDGQALNVTAEMTGAELVMPLVANARIPLRRAPGSPLPTPDINAPFSGAVDWTGDVGEIWAFVPLPDHILSGPVIINGRAGGTLAAPQLSGGAELTDGRYSNIEFGTLLTNLNAKVSFTQDGRVVFDLTGNDGVEGTVAASGSYIVASSTLDSRLSLNNAALVRRDDATAILSGDATAVSQGRDIKIDGQFRTNYVELRLIGNFGGSLTVVEAIPVGKSAPLYVPPEENAEPARNIFLNVSLDLPNRVFVRGRGLDSEWGGRLDVTGSAAKPRIVGAIERRRGFLDFLGKQFELSIGVVRFSGDTSPFVQVRLQRDANDIVGWIEVKGTVPDLDIEFGSIPALPEGEILPRLLFGRSKQSLTALEAGQLAAGVATLLSGKAGVLDSVRDAVGVDVLRVESDVDGGTSVITGKYLQDEVFVGAKQNLFTGETSGLVEVEVFDNFEFEAELGSEEAQGSVGWQIEY